MATVGTIVRAFLAVLTALLLVACTSPTPTPYQDRPPPTYFTASEVIDIVQYYLSTKTYFVYTGGGLARSGQLAPCWTFPEATWSIWTAQYVSGSWLVTRTIDWSKSPYVGQRGVLVSDWTFYERTRIVRPFARTSEMPEAFGVRDC